jgi:hypothetical protein
MGRTIDLVHEEVADGLIVVADRHPGPAVGRIAMQNFDRRRLMVSDLVQPTLPIALPGVPFDLPKDRQVLALSRADGDCGHVPSLADRGRSGYPRMSSPAEFSRSVMHLPRVGRAFRDVTNRGESWGARSRPSP